MSDDRQQTSDEWDAMVKAKTPSPLTREQVELLFQQIWDLNDQASGEALLDHDAALRATIEQQAREIERLKRQVGVWQEESNRWQQEYRQKEQQLAAMTIELEECKHQNGISARESELEQQLAASQARCRENAQALIELVGADGPMSLEDVVERVKATLAAREAELHACQSNLKQSELERDAAVQEVERLKAELSQAKRVGFDIERKDFWYWNDDKYDHLDTLICPVVVRPEKIKEWKQQLAAMTAERDEAVKIKLMAYKEVESGLLKLAASQARARELEGEIVKHRPKSECYDRVCQSLGISHDILGHVATLQATLAEREAQLPKEMPDCTIVFKECPLGHGRLTATNWIDRGCVICERNAARQDAARLREVLDEFFHYGYDRNKCDKALKGQH